MTATGGTSTGQRPLGKERSPLGVLLLSIITLGIYGLVWEYKTFQELKDYSGEGLGGLLGLVLSFFCSIIVIFVLPNEVGNLYRKAGQASPISAVTGLWVLIPFIGGIIWLFKVQGRLNDFWASQAR